MKTDFVPTIRPRDALRAIRKLLANPEDTAQVFAIIEALSGRNGERSLARFERTEQGRSLLRERPDLIQVLRDKETLRKFPDGTLGREYVRFLESEGISADGLLQASIDGRKKDASTLPPDLEFFRSRMRDTHDLWHVVTGYKGDLLGEASLLAFSFAQTRNPGVGFIVAVALLRGKEPAVRRLIFQGFLRGARAAWLPVTNWEELLALPLEEVRARLNVDAPPRYVPFRAPEYLRAQVAA
jgi:ubiquinone biosynthesis protein COQ4